VNDPRVNHRLDCHGANHPPVERRPEPAYAGRFALIRDRGVDTASLGDYRRYRLKIVRLRDVKLTG
jgi:hypothetical protein